MAESSKAVDDVSSGSARRAAIARLRSRVGYALNRAGLYGPPPPPLPKLSLETGLKVIAERWPDFRSPSQDDPVFIFSAGWRSGSTLLQRLLLASGRVLIWGEPYDRGEPIPALLRIPACFGPLWPRSDALVDEFLKTRGRESVSELKNEWTANLYPPIDSLVNAQLAFFEHFFRRPAEKLGCPRWGVKEVRLSIEHALYLKWLYPKARFLFLYRNPEAAYRSYQRVGGQWYKSWPDEPVVGPRAFGEHWRSLVEGFLDGWDRVDGLLVSYEDLTSDPATRKRIADHTGIAIPIDESLEPVASLAARQRVPVSGRALRTLWKTVGPVAQRVGYRPGV